MPHSQLLRLQLWAEAVRDSFVVLLPLSFIGVLATLMGNFPVPALREVFDSVLGSNWQPLARDMTDGSWGVLGLALGCVLSVQLARRLPQAYGSEALPSAWVAVSALVNFTLCSMAGREPGDPLMSQGSIVLGIVVGIATPELLRWLSALRAMRILAVGYDSDPAFYHATRLTAPVLALALTMRLAAEAVAGLPAVGTRWLAALPGTFNAWFDADWVLTPAAVLVNQVLWLVGIHGNKVLDQHGHAWFLPPGAPWEAGLAWRPLIDSFALLGGAGATLGLLLALAYCARGGPHRRLAQLSWLPSVFNINELLLFGLPLVLNPAFVLPFLLAPIALTMVALIAVHSGWLPLLDVSVPWTTPPLLSGWLLTGSWRGVALQAVGLAMSTLIYLPFVRRAERVRQRQQVDAFMLASNAIVGEAQVRVPSMRRADRVGVIARGLFLDLRRCIGGPQLSLVFQPQHDRAGHAIGAEALLRWQHPRHGAVRADVAVTLAEEGGLIRRLGAWVLDEACAQKARWNLLGLQRMTMAVNVSPLQLDDPQLPQILADSLHRHGVAPQEIELEITESQAIPTGSAVDDNLTRIADMGVALSMDDFGMGHTSLLHMRRFRAHAIKIDGSLTREVLTNPTSADIIRTIAALGRAQQLHVVAEVVETVAQRRRLAELGCDLFQGYLHSPPVPGPACGEYLCRHQAVSPDPHPDARADEIAAPAAGLPAAQRV